MKNIKNYLLMFILGGIIFSGISVYATFKAKADEIEYENGVSVKDKIDDLYSKTTNSFDLNIKELNGTYVVVEVPSEVASTASEFLYYIDGELKEISPNSSYNFNNLSLSTNYNIRVSLKNNNNEIFKTSSISIKTLDKLYLYDNGNEYTTLTGGWECKSRQANGLAQKKDYSLALTFSNSGTSYSTVNTINVLNLSNYSGIYVKYFKLMVGNGWTFLNIASQNSSNTSIGTYLEKFSISDFNNKVTIGNYDAYDYITEVYVKD